MVKNLNLTEDLENYILENSQKLHPVQHEIIEENKKLGDLKKLQISVSQAHFLQIIIKVTKVKKTSKIVDASVRQVSGHRKKEKIRDWKNEQRASRLLELVATKSKIDIEKLLTK